MEARGHTKYEPRYLGCYESTESPNRLFGELPCAGEMVWCSHTCQLVSHSTTFAGANRSPEPATS